jgi:hypothetical protein
LNCSLSISSFALHVGPGVIDACLIVTSLFLDYTNQCMRHSKLFSIDHPSPISRTRLLFLSNALHVHPGLSHACCNSVTPFYHSTSQCMSRTKMSSLFHHSPTYKASYPGLDLSNILPCAQLTKRNYIQYTPSTHHNLVHIENTYSDSLWNNEVRFPWLQNNILIYIVDVENMLNQYHKFSYVCQT